MTSPMQAVQVVKVITIDDLGVNIVELPYGVFLIDGEVVTNSGYGSYNTKHEIAAKEIDNIRAINTENVLVGYVPTTEGITDDVLSVEHYEDFRKELLKEAKEYHSDYTDQTELEWSSLDAEFAYRKFIGQWKPKYQVNTTYSEPLLVDRTHIRQDTGNPYIKAGFLTGQADTPLYSYSRTNAVASMLANKFESLGMEFKEGVSYGATEGKKVWSNSKHSGLEYVVAFGKYIFGKQHLPKTRGEFKGSLEHLTKIYDEDKKWIEDHIQTAYNLHFRSEAASGVLLKDVWDGLKTCIAYVNTMDVKVRSETSKKQALLKLQQLLYTVNVEILEEK